MWIRGFFLFSGEAIRCSNKQIGALPYWLERPFHRLNDLRDIQIVIAHADRYPPEDINQLISEGIPLQLNAECLRKHLHRKRYLEWIQKGYVSYLGSDIHEFGPGYHDFEKCRKLLCRYL